MEKLNQAAVHTTYPVTTNNVPDNNLSLEYHTTLGKHILTKFTDTLEPPYNALRYNAISATTLFFLWSQMIFKKFSSGLQT